MTKFWLTFHFYLHSVVNYQLLLSLSACVLGIQWSVHPGMSGLQLDMTYEIHNIMHLNLTDIKSVITSCHATTGLVFIHGLECHMVDSYRMAYERNNVLTTNLLHKKLAKDLPLSMFWTKKYLEIPCRASLNTGNEKLAT